MSRSKKKTPIGSIGSTKTMKWFKKEEHSTERSKVKNLLNLVTINSFEKLLLKLPYPKEYGNEYISPRNGKTYFGITYPTRILFGILYFGWTIEDIKKGLRK